MKLFLASEAKNPLSITKLKEYVGGFEGKTIAYIPTAANGEGWGSWKEGGSWNTVNTLGAKIDLVQIEDHIYDDVAKLIKGSDIVWFAGGMSGYLLYWMRRVKLDLQIRDILNDGTLYVGSSAGSVAACKDQTISQWYIGEEEPGADCIPGLGLVDFEIYPHYEDNLYDEVRKRFKGKKLYLLKNGEEIIVENQKIEVIGEERIITNN